MKTLAVLDEQGRVVNVVVCDDDEPESETLVRYTNENPAYIGGDYVDGFFYSPPFFPSWTRQAGRWISPVPMPTEGGPWDWDEDTLSWVEVQPLT